MKTRSLVYRLTLVVVLAGAVAWFAFHRELFSAAVLERELQRFGPWAPLLFVGVYALSTVLFVPGSVLTVVGGALFGLVWGTLWNLTGATLGATLAFVTARYVASDWIAGRAETRLAQLVRGVEGEGWRFVAFVRLVPLFPFNLVNYAFGLTRIRLSTYVLTSLVCMVPGALAYTYVGYAGWQVLSGQARAIDAGLLALALLAVVAFLPRLIRKLRGPRFTDAVTLRRWLENGQSVSLIDVRTADEFRGPLGHLCGAVNISLAELRDKIPELARTSAGPTITI